MARLYPLLILAVSACAGPALLNSVARNPDRGTEVVADIAYGEAARQRLDLYLPSDAAPGTPGDRPVLMFVHGGSWTDGDKDAYAFAGKRFASEGFVTSVPSYRVLPEHDYDDFMADMASALATTMREAGGRGGDPERVFLVGHSAGAYNVVQLALAPEFLAEAGLTPDAISAVAGLSGPYNFLPLDPGVTQDAFGGADDLDATQPVNRVAEGAPPMLLVTGTDDTVVRPRNADALAARLEAVGTPAQVVRYEGADHVKPVVAIAFPRRLPVVADITDFFAEHGSGLPPSRPVGNGS